MEIKKIDCKWLNWNNFDFYNRLPKKEFRDALSLSGLNSCADMILIQSHIDNATHILEIGAGLGRVTQYLCKNSNGAVVEAIEYSDKLYKHLCSLNLSAAIHHADALRFEPKEAFDLIVLPWACFTEFNPEEQLQLLHHLNDISTREATICIDLIMPNIIPVNACESSGQYHSLKCGKFELTLDTYLPSDEEMSYLASECGFINYHNISYVTETERLRKMHIMHKR